MTEIPNDATLGTLERQGDMAVLRYRRRLSHPRQKVWRALSEPAQLVGWFPTTMDGPMTAGAPLSFAFREMAIDPMAGEMLVFDPPSVMELRWGDDTLRFELRDEGEHTVLNLTVTFPEFGKAARDGAGWHVCLDHLAQVVAGTRVPNDEDDRWRAVHPHYVDRFGPEASSLGPPKEWEDVHGSA